MFISNNIKKTILILTVNIAFLSCHNNAPSPSSTRPFLSPEKFQAILWDIYCPSPPFLIPFRETTKEEDFEKVLDRIYHKYNINPYLLYDAFSYYLCTYDEQKITTLLKIYEDIGERLSTSIRLIEKTARP